MSSGRNTRQWRRHAVDLPIHVISSRSLPQQITARGTNISRRGMAIISEVEFSRGEILSIEFPMAAGLRVPAVVRNQNAYSAGVEFLHVKDTGDEKQRCLSNLAAIEGALRTKQLSFERLRADIEMLERTILLLR